MAQALPPDRWRVFIEGPATIATDARADPPLITAARRSPAGPDRRGVGIRFWLRIRPSIRRAWNPVAHQAHLRPRDSGSSGPVQIFLAVVRHRIVTAFRKHTPRRPDGGDFAVVRQSCRPAGPLFRRSMHVLRRRKPALSGHFVPECVLGHRDGLSVRNRIFAYERRLFQTKSAILPGSPRPMRLCDAAAADFRCAAGRFFRSGQPSAPTRGARRRTSRRHAADPLSFSRKPGPAFRGARDTVFARFARARTARHSSPDARQ